MNNEENAHSPRPPPPPPLSNHSGVAGSSKSESVPLLFQLTAVIENDDVYGLASLIEKQRADANSTLSFGVPILLKAVRSSSLNVVDYLLSKGADPLPSIRFLMCPQAFITIPFCVEMLMKLLPYLNHRVLKHTEGKNLLYRSTSCPDLSIFEYLVRQGIGFSYYDVEILTGLIKHEDRQNSEQMIKLVLDSGEIILRGNVGFTLLVQCMAVNKMDTFVYLMQKGANPFHRTQTGQTLMHYARCNVVDLICFLYDVGLDINVTDIQDLRPWDDKTYLPTESLCMSVVLGKKLNQPQETELMHGNIVMHMKMKDGEFDASKLKMKCRQRIRNLLWKHNYHKVEENIWNLPLPKPLMQFMDVKGFLAHLMNLNAISSYH